MVPDDTYQKLHASIARVIRGQDTTIRHMLAAFFSGGHVLLEDMPGTGKTTLAKALAMSLAAEFQRVQCTPDLLPSDILGVTMYDKNSGQLHFQKGPVFCDILLADEINRASPRTQAALLESMAEKQVSIDRNVYHLPDVFFVVATQNPIELQGTNPLPEAQLDRFCIRLHPGYVSLQEELEVLSDRNSDDPLRHVQPVADTATVTAIREKIQTVVLSDELACYIAELVRSTRSLSSVKYGASPRALLALARMSQALAWFDGLDYVTPEHIQEIAVPALAHRLVPGTDSMASGISDRQIISSLLRQMPVPV